MIDLTPEQTQALIARLTTLADDELLLSHRDAEWTGHAPILEEDIALANIAQDELGHAMGWLELRRTLDGSDPEGLAFRRGPERVSQLGPDRTAQGRLGLHDGAPVPVRRLGSAVAGRGENQRLHAAGPGGGAGPARREVSPSAHGAVGGAALARHAGKRAAHPRGAADSVWPYALGLFEPLDGEAAGIEAGLLPDPVALKVALADAGHGPPDPLRPDSAGRSAHRTRHAHRTPRPTPGRVSGGGAGLPGGGGMVSAFPTESAVWDALTHVTDPEIPVVNIVEMGMVRGVDIEDGRATVKIHAHLFRLPRPARYPAGYREGRCAAGLRLGPGWKPSSARRGAPTTSPRPPAPSWSSTASRRLVRLARVTPS